MYAVIQHYPLDPRRAGEVRRRLDTSFVPLLRRLPGFAAYYWLESEGAGASLSVWEDAGAAERSVRFTAEFFGEHLADELGAPDIAGGEIRIHVTSGI